MNPTLVVDAMNVIGSRPTGWWRDRDGAVRGLVERLTVLARLDRQRIVVVVDGRPIPGIPEGDRDGVHVIYAARAGRNAADDRIIEFLREHDHPSQSELYTSDRDLASRASALGARVRGASALLQQLDDLESERA